MGATYAHATAPLRRLAGRNVVRAALEIANALPVSEEGSQAFASWGPSWRAPMPTAASVARWWTWPKRCC
jgi:exoribonuclease R